MEKKPFLNVAIVQPDLIWEQKQQNLSHLKVLISQISEAVDLIVLPEMFNTGFSIQPNLLAEKMDGTTVEWMKNISAEKRVAITGSIMIEESGLYFNRLIWVDEGKVKYQYDKRHLFSLVGENISFTKGNKKGIIDFKGWKIAPFICYDLRFPVWCRTDKSVDIQLYVANWPAKRSHHWTLLLQARAVENQCFVFGANRVGDDYWGNKHTGDSCMVDYTGQAEFLASNLQSVKTFKISKTDLDTFKEKYPFHLESDTFKVED